MGERGELSNQGELSSFFAQKNDTEKWISLVIMQT